MSRILMVEDEEFLAEARKNSLRGDGIEVASAMTTAAGPLLTGRFESAVVDRRLAALPAPQG